jgi:hypothetical protein
MTSGWPQKLAGRHDPPGHPLGRKQVYAGRIQKGANQGRGRPRPRLLARAPQNTGDEAIPAPDLRGRQGGLKKAIPEAVPSACRCGDIHPEGMSAISRGLSEAGATPPEHHRATHPIPEGSQPHRTATDTPWCQYLRTLLASLRDAAPVVVWNRWCCRLAPPPPANGFEPSGFPLA